MHLFSKKWENGTEIRTGGIRPVSLSGCDREEENNMSQASESEFKGNPMIVLSQGPDDKFPFQFGLKKAKLILEHVEDIRSFIEKHSTPK